MTRRPNPNDPYDPRNWFAVLCLLFLVVLGVWRLAEWGMRGFR